MSFINGTTRDREEWILLSSIKPFFLSFIDHFQWCFTPLCFLWSWISLFLSLTDFPPLLYFVSLCHISSFILHSELTALLCHGELSAVLNLSSFLSPSIFLFLPQLMLYLLSVKKKKEIKASSSFVPCIFPFVGCSEQRTVSTVILCGAVHGAEPLTLSVLL